jgi:pSer/pThr/pTyr-binding forkhead associated (FHA) protein
MPFTLLVVQGRSDSNTLRLANGVTTLGRQDDCQIRIKSSQVSRRHCEVYEKKGALQVRDLGSSNGTFVNGKKIKGVQTLKPGDELTIGGVKLKVAVVGEGDEAGKPLAPSETAVVEAIALGEGGDDEFEIAFDDEPVTAPPASAPTKPLPAAKTAAAESQTPELPAADEAIADFLLDIKLDDEE